MAKVGLFGWLMLIIVALASLSTRIGARASPTLKTDSSPKPHEITGKVESGASASEQQATGPSLAQTSSTLATSQTNKPTNSKQVRAVTAEKLKRGLTNFMNNLNPAPYFVPTQLAGPGGKLAAGSQAEPATIINDGPSADVLIKGPNRLVQARPLGGPLRWGRR